MDLLHICWIHRAGRFELCRILTSPVIPTRHVKIHLTYSRLYYRAREREKKVLKSEIESINFPQGRRHHGWSTLHVDPLTCPPHSLRPPCPPTLDGSWASTLPLKKVTTALLCHYYCSARPKKTPIAPPTTYTTTSTRQLPSRQRDDLSNRLPSPPLKVNRLF